MGLIKAALGSAGSVLGDQWREYFYCDSMDADVLVAKAQKRTSSRSSNTRGSDNIISNGAVIAVNEGQCMMIVEQGQIVEFAAEAGEFTWNASTEGSVFYGGFGEGLKSSWNTFKRRFTFGADTAKDQRVYFFNMKEIMGNKYGTPAPVPFRVVDTNIGLDMDVSIRCNGEYSYRISDPMLFYKNVCGNVTTDYRRSQLDSQLKSEFLTALQPAQTDGVGSLTTGFRWYYAVVLTEEQADKLQQRKSLEVYFPELSAQKQVLEVERLETYPDGRAILVLKSERMEPLWLTAREQDIDIVAGIYTGLKVPAQALRQQEGAWGVFVLDGSVASFKPVTWNYSTESYFLVPCAASSKAGLFRYDRVIIQGKDLADSKIVR